MKIWGKMIILAGFGALGAALFGMRATGYVVCDAQGCGTPYEFILPIIGFFIFLTALVMGYGELKRHERYLKEP